MEAIEHAKFSLEEISGSGRWQIEVALEWPQQDNDNDCGVFVAIGCECAALGIDMMMRADRSTFSRRKIGIDLINGRLT